MNDSAEQLAISVSYSYINYIHDYLELLNNSLYSSIEYLDEETFSILKNLKEVFLSLPDIISDKPKIKEDCAAQLIGFRTVLERKYRVLNAYQRELHHLMTASNMTENISDLYDESHSASLDEVSSIDFDKLASDCVSFVFETNEIDMIQQRAALILPYIPIKITKENYLSYVKKSIQRIAVDNNFESTVLLISVLQQLFDGHLCPEYGQHFSDISETLSELSLTMHSDEFYEGAELLGETIDTLLKLLHTLYKMLGSLSNLLLFDDLNFEAITTMHLSFYDLYYSVKNVLTSDEDTELFLSTLPETVSDIKDSLQVTYQKACSLKEIDPLFALMQTYLTLDIGNIFGFSIQKRYNASNESNLTFDTFLADLKERLLTLSNQDRKLRMQYFISTIPFVMSDKNFYTYIQGAFNTLSNSKQNFVSAMYLSNVLEKNNYFEDFYEDDESPLTNTDLHIHNHLSDDHAHDCNCGDHHHH